MQLLLEWSNISSFTRLGICWVVYMLRHFLLASKLRCYVHTVLWNYSSILLPQIFVYRDANLSNPVIFT